MKYILLFLLLALHMMGSAQPMNKASQLYYEGRYEEAIETATELLNTKDSAQSNGLIGRVFVDKLRLDTAMFHLRRSVAMDGDRTWVSAWSRLYMGSAWLMKGDREKAAEELNKTIALNKTPNSVSNARRVLENMDKAILAMEKRALAANRTDSISKIKWTTIEGKHITFNFDDTAGWGNSVNEYMTAHDAAYKELSKFFRPRMPEKLKFYVWIDKEKGETLLGRVGFTDPIKCICYVHPAQSKGHEMTHAFSHWAWGKPMKYKTRFINEGVAVAFDLRDKSRIDEAKKAVRGAGIKSIADIWEKEIEVTDDVLYSVGGAFVEYLYQKGTQKQFRELVKCQSMACASVIYGYHELKAMINDFDKIVGL